MAIDPRHVGRRYGPFRNTVCADQIRAFAVAVSGGVPGYFGTARGDPHPWSVDEEAARRSPHGALVAPPTFGVTFAMKPFALACSDPELGLDLLRLLHAEQFWGHDAFLDYVDRWMYEDDAAFVKTIKEATGRDHNHDWSRQGQAWDAFVNEMWAKHRPALPAPTNGWQQPHDDTYYRAAIEKSQTPAGGKDKK